MPVESITGKNATLEVGSTSVTIWVTSMETSAEVSVDSTETWGETVTHDGSRTYSGTIEALFDPNDESMGAMMEAAIRDRTALTMTVDLGGAERVLTGWKVNSYSDSVPADGPATCTIGYTGAAMWTTTYKTTP